MSEFKSWRSYHIFENNVRTNTRYIYSQEIKDFLESVVTTINDRIKTISIGSSFWRAQLGHTWSQEKSGNEIFDVQAPYSKKRMKPIPEVAKEGRINPKGIAYLYLATDANTAMAESRPWKGAHISIGQFKITKDLQVIDCTLENEKVSIIYFDEPDHKKKEKAVWRDISESFSKPVNKDDLYLEYIPTQILSELFKREGFDGILYNSNLGEGKNLALFDLVNADLKYCSLSRCAEVMYKFKKQPKEYYLK